MAKVEAIVGRALRLIGVVDPRQPVQPVDMQTGITAMNAMLRRWEADGAAMGWNDVSAADEDMPCPAEAEEAITSNLAVTLAPEYGEQASPVLLAMAMRGIRDMDRDSYTSSAKRLRLNLPRNGRYNIYTDSYHD